MPRRPDGERAMTDAERQRKHRQERGPHLSDHQKLAQARAEIARLRKAEAKAELLTDAIRRKLEGELIKVKLENDRLREQLAAKPKPAKSAPQPRVFLTFRPSIEGHPISGTLMDRYVGKAKTRKKTRKKARKKARKKTRKKTRG
jgi:hypothetical protein